MDAPVSPRSVREEYCSGDIVEFLCEVKDWIARRKDAGISIGENENAWDQRMQSTETFQLISGLCCRGVRDNDVSGICAGAGDFEPVGRDRNA